MGPRILTATLLPAGDACAAVAEADARARLIYGSGVRENVVGDTDNIIVLGNGTVTAEAAMERAAGMFETPLGDVLAIEDRDPDNVVDVCLRMAPDAAAVADATITMTCEDASQGSPDFVVRDPEGEACEAQTVELDMSGFTISPAPAPAQAPAPAMALAPQAGAGAVTPAAAAVGPEADMPAGSEEGAPDGAQSAAGVLLSAGTALVMVALMAA